MKTKAKVLSLVLAVLLLGSMMTVGAAAAGENQIVNASLQLTDGNLVGWGKSGAGAESAWSEIIKTDETFPGTGVNVFQAVLPNTYITMAQGLPLNENKQCYVTFWYKSSADYYARVWMSEMSSPTTLVQSDIVVKELAKTSGVWTKVSFVYTAKNETATHAKVTFLNRGGDSAQTALTTFAAPTYSTDVPEEGYLANGSFDSGTSDWLVVGSDIGEMSIRVDENANSYLVAKSTGSGNYRLRTETTKSKLLTNGDTYKITFKFMPLTEGATPRLDVFTWTEAGYEATALKDRPLTALGTLEVGKWTEYVAFVPCTGERTDKDGAARRLQIQLYCMKGHTVALDDVTVSEEKDEVLLYNNGVETDKIANGDTIGALYHQKSEKATLIIALYKVNDDDTLTLASLVASADCAAGDYTNSITVPNDGATYKLSAFIWDGISTMQAVSNAKTIQ